MRRARAARRSTGKTALDVGCGAGLLAEPLARLGAKVTGIDASAEVIAVAREHAQAMGLEIDYRAGDVEELEGRFDLDHLHGGDRACRRSGGVSSQRWRSGSRRGGLLILSTPNATGWSKLMMITVGEGLGRIPKGTHDFDKFIAPERMKVLLADAGTEMPRRRGHRLVADARASPQRRHAAELSRRGGTHLAAHSARPR